MISHDLIVKHARSYIIVKRGGPVQYLVLQIITV